MQARHRDRRRRGRALSVDVERAAAARIKCRRRADAGRRHRGQEGRPGSRCRSCANWSPTSCWSTRRSSSARSTPISPCRRRWRKAPAPPGSPRMLAEPERFRGKKVGLILCGGNIDPRILASIMVRELERESRIVSFRLTIHRSARRARRRSPPARRARRQYSRGRSPPAVSRRAGQGRQLDVTVETRDAAHAEQIQQRSPPTAIGRHASSRPPRSDAPARMFHRPPRAQGIAVTVLRQERITHCIVQDRSMLSAVAVTFCVYALRSSDRNLAVRQCGFHRRPTLPPSHPQQRECAESPD